MRGATERRLDMKSARKLRFKLKRRFIWSCINSGSGGQYSSAFILSIEYWQGLCRLIGITLASDGRSRQINELKVMVLMYLHKSKKPPYINILLLSSWRGIVLIALPLCTITL
jgi:hypothetical protein